MYCPTCAAQNEAGVKFCRSCGRDLTLIAQALTKSGPVMLLGQIKKELQEGKERQKQPRITRGLLWTGISIAFFVLWCVRLYQHSAEFGTVVLGLVNAFVFLGIGMLVVGIGYHIAFMMGLRREREQLKRDGLIHADSQFPVSLTLAVAILLLAIGVAAIVSMVYDVGPFG